MTPSSIDPRPRPGIPEELGGQYPGDDFHERLFRMGDAAAPAIAGIRPSAIADKLDAYQKLYMKELSEFPLSTGWRWWLAQVLGFDRWKSANQISRMELKDLALAHATVLNNKIAQVAQEENAKQFQVLAGSMNDLHHFLLEHFRNDLIVAQDTNKSLFQLVKELLLRKGN